MALTSIQVPNQINYSQQTIPFVVMSDLFKTLNFDVIERSFKYLFEVKTLRADGFFKTYSTVAIAPRPDTLAGFFDVSSVIKSAVTSDLGTHTVTGATQCEKSIVEFQVTCTERYLDTNGVYQTGSTSILGTFYAINAGPDEDIDNFVMDGVSVKKPLHQHFLLKDDFKLFPNEPLSLSWISPILYGENELTQQNCNYGDFNKLDLGSYTGVTFNMTGETSQTMVNTGGIDNTGAVLIITGTGITTGTTNFSIMKFIDIPVANSKTYQADIWIRTMIPYGDFDTRRLFYIRALGSHVATTVSATPAVVWNTGYQWYRLSTTFTTNTTPGNIDLEVYLVGNLGVDLTPLNQAGILIDSGTLREKSWTGDTLDYATIIVDEGKASTITYRVKDSYWNDILPINDWNQVRFDTPIGAYTTGITTGSTQTSEGFYKNSNGVAGEYFTLNLYNNANVKIGKSEKIYQSLECAGYKHLRVKWLNKFGGWDYYTFDLVSSAKSNVERSEYKISNGSFDSTLNYSEDNTNRGYNTLNIRQVDTFTMNSNWISNETAKFIQGLFLSHEVYLLNPEIFENFVDSTEWDLEYPIILQDQEIEYKTNSKDKKLINISINVTPGRNFTEKTRNI